MNTGLISIRYAKALLQTGIEKELLGVLYENGTNIFALLKEVPELDDFLKNPVIKSAQKKQFIRKTFDKFNILMLNFIDVIIDNKREKLINDIIRNFLDLYRKECGIKNVTVITAINIEDSYRQEILDVLGQQLKTRVELECKVDDEIIGGLVIIVDDKQADGSIAGELRALKKKMMN